MSTNLVIVAIPEDMDRVWKISSEKVPHLTLLFLGEADTNPHLETIMQFVEHATTLSEHGPFYLEVDHRGTLGPDNADVIFFSERNRNLKWIKQFRGQLLQNQQIRSAYDSTDQFEEWEPHLTLGYPDTPANEPGDGFDHPLYSVCFDRIAVWTGDYLGPDFRLEWPEREFEGDMAVAWSDAKKAELLHYGAKGMRWGQRKTETTATGKKVTPKKLAKLDKKFEKNAGSLDTFLKVHNRAADLYNTQDIGRINNKPEYKDVNFRKLGNDHATTKKYEQEHADAFTARLKEAGTQFTNASGTRHIEAKIIQENGEATVSISSVDSKVTHAIKAEVVKYRFAKDATGVITKIEPIETSMAQTAELGEEFIAGFKPDDTAVDYGEVFVDGLLHGSMKPGEAFVLEHYGIKGMRWGFRRPAPPAVTATASSHVPQGNKRKTKVKIEGGQNHPAHEDAIKVAEARGKLKKSGPAALSNQELRDVANRLQLENQVSLLTSSKGKLFVKRELQTGSQNLAKAGAKKAARAGAKKAATAVLL